MPDEYPDDPIITSTSHLESFCAQLRNNAFVAVDTEFIREKTFYPQLCLIQVAGEEVARAVDPLAEGIDLTPLWELMFDPQVIKIFHAGRQDVEIVHYLTGRIPDPVFDTQIAAQFCGFGESIAYGDFVRETLNITIDKASRFTDWARRPLTQRQIDYALADVIHLREAYDILVRRLEKAQRLAWVAEEMASLTDPAVYACAPEDAWKRLKAGHPKPRHLAALQALAAWRERQAQRLNVPRARILRDEALIEIAALMPHSPEELRHVRSTGGLGNAAAEAILTALEEVRRLPPESLPQPDPRRARPAQADALPLLQMLLAVQCRRYDIIPRLVATREELEALAAGERNIRVMYDWRYEIFGRYALELIKGKLSLRFDPSHGSVVLE